MPDAGLLVFAGLNGVVSWEERDCPECEALVLDRERDETGHPWVVFAVRPEFDVPCDGWLAADPGASAPRAEWYKCLWPPTANSLGASIRRVEAPIYGPSASAVQVTMVMADGAAGITWELDAKGEFVPCTRRVSDWYQRNLDKLPDPTLFDLRALPRVKGCAEEPRVTPAALVMPATTTAPATSSAPPG